MKNKQLRRLKQLILQKNVSPYVFRKNSDKNNLGFDYIMYYIVENINEEYNANIIENNKNLREMKQLIVEMNLSFEDFIVIYDDVKREQKERQSIYNRRPIRVRKDNGTTINYGSGGRSLNKIRRPSLKRKTAWKRFYKLFPHLKENENI